MPVEDQLKWDAKYSQASDKPDGPSMVLTELYEHLPQSGSALDVAGGTGRHSRWLAKHGLNVTLVDVSPIGLRLAQQYAAQESLVIKTECLDVEEKPLPTGPWNLIVSHHFLFRPLFAQFADAMTDGGKLIFVQPTVANLERHAKPPRRFLLEEGELPSLVQGLSVVHYSESWNAEGRHEAVLVAEK